MSLSDFLFDAVAFLRPWQPSLLAIVFFGALAVLYWRGVRKGGGNGFWHQVAFWLGLSLCYIVLHTRFDYYAQYMFFMHRIQHLVLHHLGPFLLCLSAPGAILMRGLGEPWAGRVRRLQHHPLVWRLYLLLQNPFVASVLFVGLIAFWLNPQIHFYAMLNESLYMIMNWSMFLDGLLFWWLVLDPASKAQGARVSYGARIAMLILVAPAQIVIGAYIAYSKTVIYDVYSVCGRAWPMAPIDDQTVGGLVTWIPAAMMSVLAMVIVIRFMFKSMEAEAGMAETEIADGQKAGAA